MGYVKSIISKHGLSILKIYAVVLIVLVYLDYKNVLTKYFINLPKFEQILTLFFIILISVIIILELKVYHYFTSNSINIMDLIFSTMFLSSITYIGFSYLIEGNIKLKIIVSILIFLTSAIYITVKFFKFRNSSDAPLFKNNVLDLKAIYEDNFEVDKDSPLFLDERAVEYDLLDRGRTINLLTSTIINCNPNGSFTISLEGKWGSGKTTLLNNVKNKLKEIDPNIVVIDYIDPWLYESKEILFKVMFERILKESNVKYHHFSIESYLDSVYEEIFGDKKANFFSYFFKKDKDFLELKNELNSVLFKEEVSPTFRKFCTLSNFEWRKCIFCVR